MNITFASNSMLHLLQFLEILWWITASLCFTAFEISDEWEISSSGPRMSVSGVRSSWVILVKKRRRSSLSFCSFSWFTFSALSWYLPVAIQLFHTRPIGRNPEFAILRLRHTGNIVGSNAGSILGIIYHAVQFAARDALSVSPLIIIKEAVAIKTP